MVLHGRPFSLFAFLVAMLVPFREASQEGGCESSDGGIFDTETLWPPVDGELRLANAFGIRSADDTTVELVPNGVALPASGRALVTTVSDKPSLTIEVVTGNRFSATSNKLLGRVTFNMTGDDLPRGIPQVLVTADVRDTRVRITIRNMLSGRKLVVMFNAGGQMNASSETGLGGFTDKSQRGFLPRPWKFDNPYTSVPHPGYTFGGHFLKLNQRARTESDAAVPKQHGDVLPSFTADKVWPAAYVMGDFLEKMKIQEPDVPFGRVLELGAGTGLVGMAAALLDQSGSSHITLTDLVRNCAFSRQFSPRSLTPFFSSQRMWHCCRAMPN